LKAVLAEASSSKSSEEVASTKLDVSLSIFLSSSLYKIAFIVNKFMFNSIQYVLYKPGLAISLSIGFE